MLELESDPYSMFVFAMNAKQTREKYSAMLTISIVFVTLLVLTQTLLVSNSFVRIFDQTEHNAFGQTSGNVTSLTEKAVVLNSLGRFDEALSYLDKALSIDPNNVRAYINKGRALSQLHKFEEAILNYDRALSIDPQNTDAYINKGLSLYNLGKNEAMTYFDKVLTAEPNNLLASTFKHRAQMN